LGTFIVSTMGVHPNKFCIEMVSSLLKGGYKAFKWEGSKMGVLKTS